MITKEMTIDEILKRYPDRSQKIASLLAKFGFTSLGCDGATYETLEVASLENDLELSKILEALNAILEEKLDHTTITLTQKAADRFKQIVKEEGREADALRLSDRPAGCSGYEYIFDFSSKKKDNDVVFSSHGVEIHVDKESLNRLIGSEIDFFDGLSGAGFKVTNPNVKVSCNCGSSHSY